MGKPKTKVCKKCEQEKLCTVRHFRKIPETGSYRKTCRKCEQASQQAKQKIKYHTDPVFRVKSNKKSRQWIINHPGYQKEWHKKATEELRDCRVRQALKDIPREHKTPELVAIKKKQLELSRYIKNRKKTKSTA